VFISEVLSTISFTVNTMPQRFIKSIFALSIVHCLTFASFLHGQETQPADLTNRVTQINSTIVHKLSKAFGGDVAAQQDLIRNYLAPCILTLTVLFFCYLVASSIGRVLGGFVSKRVDLTLGRFLAKAIRILLMIFVGMLVLEYNNISVSGFAAILAAMSFAIGLALQGTLSNFAAGIMLLIFRPFKVDDFIVVAGIEGRVEEIDLFTTRVNTRDNRHVIVPNSEIFGNKLENYDRNPLRRVDVNVATPFSANLKLVRSVLNQALAETSEACEIDDGQVVLLGIGTHAMQWQIRASTPPAQVFVTKEILTENTKNCLDANNIPIGLPQLDIHVAGKLLAKAG
jgi:small conductance mechanosensitive channel